MISRRRPMPALRVLAAIFVAAVGLGVVAPPAPAAPNVAIVVTPTFPSPVTVGRSGLAASIKITNTTVGAVATVDTITLVPSCGTTTVTGDCPPGSTDPGVFRLSATATGAGSCAGDTFTVSAPDTTGKVTFAPGVPALSIGSGASCTIDFTVDVLKLPSGASTTNQLASASGPGTAGAGFSTTTVLAQPTITTAATASATVGQPVMDVATLAGGFNPTGTIDFELFDATGAACDTSVVFRASDPVNGNGSYSSGPFIPTGPGVYHWNVSYSGDANNAFASDPCPNEATTVTVRATPTVVTTASAPVAVGGTISDRATLAGGNSPTGSITFTAFDNATCSGAAAFTSTAAVAGNGTYASATFTTTAAGTYRFVASYSGDGNNTPATTSCGDANEAVVVAPATTAVMTNATATVALGGPVSDTATLTGGVGPTGTITFRLFSPGTLPCATAVAFTQTVAVSGNGLYQTTPFTPVTQGSYHWDVAYSGDANNQPAAEACPNEVTAVGPATPTIATTATATATVGGTIADSAVLSGGAAPTGTITFHGYGPGDPTCTATPVFTATVTVSTGNGTYPSGSFTATAPGAYHFTASYSGDGNNAAAASGCGAANETSAVAKATPGLSTTPSATTTVGGSISDVATLSGGAETPTGTIVFRVFGPNNSACAGAPAFTSTTTVSGNGSYSSASFPTTAVGTYIFDAAYLGDANNTPVTDPCDIELESVTVKPAVTTLATTASASVAAGGMITDTATLSGGFTPSGSVTFNLFGPSNPTCTGTPIFTSTKTVTGNGVLSSDPFTTTAPGTYLWVAAYGGDADNQAAGAACGAANESVVVTAARPTIATRASPAVAIGGTVSDQATLAGGVGPTGTVSFSLFGPLDPTCTGTPLFTSTNPLVAATAASGTFTTAATGQYHWVASYGGDANNATVTGACGDANESVSVTAAGPTITTHASAPVPVGGRVTDTATLAGGVSPTGTVTFSLYGPGNATCAGVAIFTSTKSVAGNGDVPSDAFTPAAAGTYRFVARYSGDTNNNPAATACGDANEQVVVAPAATTITTAASAPVTAGGTISDTATLAGGVTPTGTITFDAFGPNDPTCATPVFTSMVAVAGNGTYASGTFATTAAGTYLFVATYSGDANNAAAATACGDGGESVPVTAVTPVITTTASPSAVAGQSIADTATLAGGFKPTGTVTFSLFGPGDFTCAAPPVFISSRPVAGNGSVISAPFTAALAGTYRFRAAYSGDANNNAVSTGCGDAAETVVVIPASPTLTTQASSSVPAGATVSDTAIVAGGDAPTGTISFTLFGPNDPTCSSGTAPSLTVPIAGAGSYPSGAFPVTAAGSYDFVARYLGDANNQAAATGCGDTNEVVVVTPASPTVATNASASVPAGSTIGDTATLSGGVALTGTITFHGYGPGDPTCTGTPMFTSSVGVEGSGTYTSDSFTAPTVGTYRFVAVYSGDTNNNPATTSCGDAGESVTVTVATPGITTAASGPVAVGGSVSDTAQLTGGANPAGTLTFLLFGPGDTTCSNAPVFTSTVAVHGDGTYPSGPFTATTAGTYLWVADYSGDATNNNGAPTSCGSERVDVVVITPSLTTSASPPAPVGGTINDTAFLSDAASPTGSITFTLFGPNDATCAGTAVFTSTVAVDGNGTYTSSSFTSVLPGTYRFVAAYSGDGNNKPLATACGDPGESVDALPPSPTLTTQASASVDVGGMISDTATLAGGSSPTGTIVFNLYGPDDLSCANSPVFTSTVTVAGNGAYPSGPFSPTSPGTYLFTASYSGDPNNGVVATNCGDANESVVVTSPNPVLTTQASGSVTLGGSVNDTAIVTGGRAPAGQISFALYGPNDAMCANRPVFTANVIAAGDGSYPSASFTPAAVGTYLWTASLNNDGLIVATNCGDPNESVDVTPPSPVIVTTASPAVTVGGTISDTASLSGGTSPSGTITFSLFGPDDSGCSNGSIFTTTVPVAGNGTYQSGPFAPVLPGLYQYIASYSGDANNGLAQTNCGDGGESVSVSGASPTIVTTPSGPVAVGSTMSDTAVLAGAFQPRGSITFQLFGTGDTTCSSAPVFTSTVGVDGNGTYPSGSYTPLGPGTYRWVAAYSGDNTANNAVTSSCGDEVATVTPASPSLATVASPSVLIGGVISDTATLTGAVSPTGTITFQAFGPNDSECTGNPVFTATQAVVASGAVSGPFTPTAAGTYQFVARYGGDANNNPAATSCGDPVEAVQVTTTTSTSTTSTSTTSTSTTSTSSTSTSTTSTSTTSTSTTTPTTTTTTTTVPVTTTTTTSTTTTSTTITSTTTTSTTTGSTTTSSTTKPTVPPATAPPSTRVIPRATTTTVAPATTVPPTTVPPTTTTSTTTVPPTTTTTVPPAAAVLKLDRISTSPGGPAKAIGQGCTPNSPVTLTVGSLQVGNTVARPDGTFTADLHLDVPVGQYQVVAVCGPTLTATIDVVLSSQANTPTSTAAILLILLLLILVLGRGQFSGR